MKGKEIHPHMQRLYQVAREQKLITGRAPQAEVAALLNVSSQRVFNWESRGLSKEVALEAQHRHGINATYLMEGRGPKMVGGGDAVAQAGPRWPFQGISPERYARVPERVQGIIEGRALTIIEDWEAEAGKSPGKGRAA